MSYAAHAKFVEPARARSEFWRFILGVCLAFGIYVALTMLYFQSIHGLLGPIQADEYAGALFADNTPLGMYLMLFSFALMALSVALVVRTLHGRGFVTLFGNLHTAFSQFRSVAVMLVLLLAVVFILPPWSTGGPLVANLPLTKWLLLLPVSMAAVLLQVSAEEIVFRGYIQQQLAARFRSPLVWMVLPAVVFAVGHYLPEEAGENAVLIAVWSGVFGMLMADLTARSGTLGPAIAVHFCNNVVAMLITAMPDDLSGLALFVLPFGLENTAAVQAWLPVDFALMIVFWLGARLAIRR